MAKYTIKNRVSGDRRVNCRVLNECAGDYVVQFDDKSIKRVPADRVDSLNRIDEGVLDRVREFGGKIVNAFKKIGRWIQACIGGEPIPTGIPANGYIDIPEMQGAAFYGSPASREIASENGISANDVDNIDEEYDDGMGEAVARRIFYTLQDLAIFVNDEFRQNESKRSPYRKVNALNEKIDVFQDPKLKALNFIGNETAIKAYLQYSDDDKKNKENAKGYSTTPIDTFGLEDLLSKTLKIFIKSGVPSGKKSYPCIWGAGGIGKTDIIVNMFRIFKKKYPDLNFFYVNLATTQKYDLILPEIQQKDNGSLQNVTVYKSWLPVYKFANIYNDLPVGVRNAFGPLIEKNVISRNDLVSNYNMVNDEIANGGAANLDPETGEVIVSRRGTGGILFFDELSRSEPKVLSILMTILSDRIIEEGTIGSKWVFVFAGNMLQDLQSAAKLRNDGKGSVSMKDIQFLIDGPVADRLDPYEFTPDVERWVTHIRKKYHIPEEICEFFLQYPKMYLHNPMSFVDKDGKNLIVDTFKTSDKNVNNGIKLGNPRNWVSALTALMSHMSDYSEFVDNDETFNDIFKMAGITFSEYESEEPDGSNSEDEVERVQRGIKVVDSELEKRGLEPADVLDYYHYLLNVEHKAGKLKDGNLDPERMGMYKDSEKYNDFMDIPLDDAAETIYNKVGAVATVNFVNYMKQMREFSLNTARGLIDGHPTVNGKVDEDRNYIMASDVKGLKYDGFLSKRIARLIGAAMGEKYAEGGEKKLVKMPEYYNIIRYIIVLGRSLGFDNKPLLCNLYYDTMIEIVKQTNRNVQRAGAVVDEEAKITILALVDKKDTTDEALYVTKSGNPSSVIDNMMDKVHDIAEKNVAADIEARKKRLSKK